MRKMKLWQWIVLAVLLMLVLTFVFFYAYWFSYRLGARHCDEQIDYPIEASALLLIPTVVLWIRTKRKRGNPFWAIFVSILFGGAILCIFGGLNGGCPFCDYPPDRVYQWLRTQFLGSPLTETW